MNDSEWQKYLLRIKDGDEAAFNIIYDATHQGIYRMILMMVYHEQDAEDIMNEVYMQMWKSLENYDYNCSFQAWLYGITIRQIRSFKRKKWRIFRIFEKETLFMSKTEAYENDKSEQLETKDEILLFISRLPDKQKEVLILRYYHEYSFEEIASILDISINTAKSRHRLALEKLRKGKDELIYLRGRYNEC